MTSTCRFAGVHVLTCCASWRPCSSSAAAARGSCTSAGRRRRTRRAGSRGSSARRARASKPCAAACSQCKWRAPPQPILCPSSAHPVPVPCPSSAHPVPILCPCFVLVLCPSRHSAAPAPSAAALIFQGLQGGRASAWCPRAARHFQPLRPQPLGPQRPNRDHLAGSREIAAPPKSLNPLRACAACVCHVRIAQRWST